MGGPATVDANSHQGPVVFAWLAVLVGAVWPGGACGGGREAAVTDAAVEAWGLDDAEAGEVDALGDGDAGSDPDRDADREGVGDTGADAWVDAAPPNPCDDGDPCTRDLPFKAGCQHELVPDGSPCAHDGDPCTWDACFAGVCQHVPREAGWIADVKNQTVQGPTYNIVPGLHGQFVVSSVYKQGEMKSYAPLSWKLDGAGRVVWISEVGWGRGGYMHVGVLASGDIAALAQLFFTDDPSEDNVKWMRLDGDSGDVVTVARWPQALRGLPTPDYPGGPPSASSFVPYEESVFVALSRKTENYPEVTYGARITRLDMDGKILSSWAYSLPTIAVPLYLGSLFLRPEGLVLVGQDKILGGPAEILILRVGFDGAIQSQSITTLTRESSDWDGAMASCLAVRDADILFVGRGKNGHLQYRRRDYDGHVLSWEDGGIKGRYASAAAAGTDGSFLVVGDHGGPATFLARLDTDGHIVWDESPSAWFVPEHYYTYASATAVLPVSEGGYLFGGRSILGAYWAFVTPDYHFCADPVQVQWEPEFAEAPPPFPTPDASPDASGDIGPDSSPDASGDIGPDLGPDGTAEALP